MKFFFNLLAIFSVCLFASSQEIKFNQLNNNNQKNGPWIEYHEKTNTKRYTGNFKNNKPTGIFNYYSVEGFLFAKLNFINDSIAESKMFFDSGKIMAQGIFLNKIKEGKWITYSRYGDILNVFNFKKGEMDGKQLLYFPIENETNSVKLMEEYNCKNGLKNGPWYQYYQLGKLKVEGSFKMGKKDGDFIYYFSDGSIENAQNP